MAPGMRPPYRGGASAVHSQRAPITLRRPRKSSTPATCGPTINPSSAQGLIDPVIEASADRMKKEGVLQMSRKLLAEGLGTFWLVFGGCGSAVLAAAFPEVGIGLLGVSAAFGLTVLTMAYTIGHISGCHLNPAVSVGLWAGGRFDARDVVPYILAQVAGAVAAAALLLLVASGKPGFDIAGGLAANGVGLHSPGGYSMTAGFVMEVVMTAMFLVIIMGSTDRPAAPGFAPIAIGLGLTLIHLVSIPVTNTSVNPARSTGPALVAGGWALQQLWIFWVAPLIGGVIGGFVYHQFEDDSVAPAPGTRPRARA